MSQTEKRAMNQIPYILQVVGSTENLAKVRSFIREKAYSLGVNQVVIDKVVLAVDEACSNIIRHAYKPPTNGDITVKLSVEDEQLTITLMDKGVSFDPQTIQSPDMKQYLSEKRVGGLGIHLMRLLMDNVEYYTNTDGLNTLKLTKRITA